MQSRVLRRADVCRVTGLSYSSIFRLEREGGFPARFKLGACSVGWRADEVEAWIADRTRITSPTP